MEEVMTLEQQEGKKTDRKKKKGCTCCAVGCGLPLLAVVLMISSWLWYVMYYHEFGENKDSFSRVHAPKGTNFSYDSVYMRYYCEFTIFEEDFLGWCKNRTNPFEILEIKDLPSLPALNWHLEDRDKDKINERRGSQIPLSIVRYNMRKPEHENCNPWDWNDRQCKIDPAGKNGGACFRFVSDGYYFEHRLSNGGGAYILYDRETHRCYIEWDRR